MRQSNRLWVKDAQIDEITIERLNAPRSETTKLRVHVQNYEFIK